jgi:hypothetical protein
MEFWNVIGLRERRNFFHRPDVIGDASFHRWGDTTRLMDMCEVVMHLVERDRICGLFGLV